MAFDLLKSETKFPDSSYNQAGIQGAANNKFYGGPATAVGLMDLKQLLLGQGRVDPRLLASTQAANARSTQQQQDAARAVAARRGLGGGGLSDAIMAAIGAAGANRSANINYQDIADSYQRRQENLGLLNQLVIQPSLGYGSLGNQWGLGQQEARNNERAGQLGFLGALAGSAGKAFGAGG